MLSAEKAKLTAFGKVEITPDGVRVEGFDADNGTCRDVAALAVTWAIGELQRELLATLQQPGGGNICVD